jgi:predicted SAM-dependent methyltransferase
LHALKTICSELSWAGLVMRRRLRRRLHAAKRRFASPPLPRNPDGKVYVHLGCGQIASPEFINVDTCPAPHVHYVQDACDLSVFPDDHADLLYACHLLEHIDRENLKRVLWEWSRVLKPGGILRLSVPDFDRLVAAYRACGNDVESICGPLMGAWLDYNPHRMIFNYEFLARLMRESGFCDIHRWDPAGVDHHAFDDWASKAIRRDGREFHISLNVEGTKSLQTGNGT